jgi:small nuclear ribonucleoprotein G
MDKKLFVHLQGGRKVSGVLRGYDLFLNLVIDDALEETTPAQKHPIGTVVSTLCVSDFTCVYATL